MIEHGLEDELKRLRWLAGILTLTPVLAVAEPYHDYIDEAAAELAPKVITWRCDIHQNPELSNREVRTTVLIAEHLAVLGLERITHRHRPHRRCLTGRVWSANHPLVPGLRAV